MHCVLGHCIIVMVRRGKTNRLQKKYYKYEKYNLDSIKEYAKRNGIKITGKKKQELIDELNKKINKLSLRN